MSSPDEWLALVRWRNAALAAAGVCAAAWWSAGIINIHVCFAAAAAVALTAVANTSNDLADIEIDRVAHPERPLPSGTITPHAATRLAIGSAVVALVLTVLVDHRLAFLTVGVLMAMWLYSARIKRHGIPGNITVAVLASLPFLYGGWAVGEVEKGALLVTVAAPLHFAREVSKDIEDAAADSATRQTLPITHGVGAARATIVVGVAAYVMAILLVARSHPLFAISLVPTIFLAGFAVWRLYRGADGTASLLKVAMVLAIVALVINGG